MTNMNYGHLTLFDDALNEWLQKMDNYCEMRAAYTQWGRIMFKIAIIRNFVLDYMFFPFLSNCSYIKIHELFVTT